MTRPPPPNPPFRYSNAGPMVLGWIVERLTNLSYHEYVERHVLAPAGMNDTGYDELNEDAPNLATGYTQLDIRFLPDGMGGEERPGPSRSNVLTLPFKGSPAGGACSTVDDLLRLSRSLQDGRLLSPAFTDTLLRGRMSGSWDAATVS